jgi:hypothetical protein
VTARNSFRGWGRRIPIRRGARSELRVAPTGLSPWEWPLCRRLTPIRPLLGAGLGGTDLRAADVRRGSRAQRWRGLRSHGRPALRSASLTACAYGLSAVRASCSRSVHGFGFVYTCCRMLCRSRLRFFGSLSAGSWLHFAATWRFVLDRVVARVFIYPRPDPAHRGPVPGARRARCAVMGITVALASSGVWLCARTARPNTLPGLASRIQARPGLAGIARSCATSRAQAGFDLRPAPWCSRTARARSCCWWWRASPDGPGPVADWRRWFALLV